MAKLAGLVDEGTGDVAINELFDTARIYHGPYLANAPDLVVGYNAGYRVSWDCATGNVAGPVFEDNVKPGAATTASIHASFRGSSSAITASTPRTQRSSTSLPPPCACSGSNRALHGGTISVRGFRPVRRQERRPKRPGTQPHGADEKAQVAS